VEGRLFVVSQFGRIFWFDNRADAEAAHLFLDISDRTEGGGEVGLLGLAFDPLFRENGKFYCYYASSERSIVARYSVDPANPDTALASSEEIILSIEQTGEGNHKGGQISFGPDGYLYIGLGDGGGAGDPFKTGQDRTSFLGKILRIDVHDTSAGRPYAIPADNPFAGNTAGRREEIYAYGLRNPWRFSFDPPTGRLWAGDVGQGTWEEIDLVTNGGNYGWSIMEGGECYRSGSCDTTGLTMPVWTYRHGDVDSITGNSVIGGYVYRGSRFPELVGKYIYGDLGTGNIWALEYDPEGATTSYRIVDSDLIITSFGVDERGELYICSFANPSLIYRLAAPAAGVRERPDPPVRLLARVALHGDPSGRNPTIEYTLVRPADVRLAIVDVRGSEIGVVAEGMRDSGDHHQVIPVDGLARGSYYYVITAGDERMTGRFVIP
jgi:glucose/arabinose dehydrogenase